MMIRGNSGLDAKKQGGLVREESLKLIKQGPAKTL